MTYTQRFSFDNSVTDQIDFQRKAGNGWEQHDRIKIERTYDRTTGAVSFRGWEVNRSVRGHDLPDVEAERLWRERRGDELCGTIQQ